MFIGREKELQFLEEKYTSSKAQLVVLYGRRRIGKTETLKEFCRGKPHLYYSCTQSTDRVQLNRFSTQLLRENIPAGQYIHSFEEWESAFRALLTLPYGEVKKLVVIDEFPYMCRGNSSIPSIIQNLWDGEWKDANIMLILCGSAMSFIEKELLAEKNPLYGRATGIYKMNEMGFYDAIRFFPDYTPRDKVLSYAVLGGIPHYLNQWEPELSVCENIKRNILTKGCTLYSEVEFLLHQELRETPVYNAIIEAVALGSTRLNEISSKSLVEDVSKTSVYLKNLIELGIVERAFSVDAKTKEMGSGGRGLYRLTDHFFRFWYTFGFPNFSQLEDGDVDGVYEYAVMPSLHAFASLPFEGICQEFVRELQKKNMLPFRYAKMGRWTGKTTVRDEQSPKGVTVAETEIDILAMDRTETAYLVGECKYKAHPFRYGEYLNTKAKLTPWKERAKFYYMLFSESGFDDKIMAEADGENLILYPLETIVDFKK